MVVFETQRIGGSAESEWIRSSSHRSRKTSSRGVVFFFQAEDGIRDLTVTGVQTCALPISLSLVAMLMATLFAPGPALAAQADAASTSTRARLAAEILRSHRITLATVHASGEIGRASCRERV